jgi:predicted O-linked N-acetylglucosamine transferase (SPINDLY family)
MFKLFKAKAPIAPTAADIAAKFAEARALCDQGRLAEAGAICREVASARSDDADVLMLSAEIAARSGDLAAALPLYARAAELRPDDGLLHYLRGNAQVGCGQLEAALASYDHAAALTPSNAGLFCNRGVVLERLDRLEAALESYARALTLDPGNALTHYNCAGVLLRLGRKPEALRSYALAVAADPGQSQAHFHRANLLKELERWDEALASYDKAIEADPGFAAAYGYRGVLLFERKQWDAALASYDRAIALAPGYAEAYYNRGLVYHRNNQFEAALADYEKAIELVPHYAEAHMNRGAVLYAKKRFDAALMSFDVALELDPDYIDAIVNRGMLLLELKLWDDALASLERLLALRPTSRSALGMRTFVQMSMCDWREFDANVAALEAGINADLPLSSPMTILAFMDRPELQQRAAQIWAREACSVPQALPPITPPAAADKIRIGYFSPDFRDHAVAVVTAQLFECHDRAKFEITAFSFCPEAHDDMRERLKLAFDRFVDASEMPDREVALLARRLGIDIAVDLAGYTLGCRSGIFALRAAPLQVNYLGYPGTIGAQCMDYLIGDRTVIPDDQRHHYSEKIIALPHSYLPHDTTRVIADVSMTREQFGLPAQAFVFCCFNGLYKITPDVFDGWMRILTRVPAGVLWFSQSNASAAANLRREAAKRGVDPQRLIFAERVPSQAEHLARHALGDLFLDTLPYNAHSTAMDALWAGLPVLTRVGRAFPGRVAASLLKTIGLTELIAETAQQYEDLAVALAVEPTRLAALRRRLAENRLTTPLFDIRTFTRDLEGAYAAIHARYRAGLAPEHMICAGGGVAQAAATAEDATALYQRANRLKDDGRLGEALANYDRAIELKPDHAYAYCNRGVVLERLDRWDEARDSYERAIAIAPDDAVAHYNRGTVLRKLGKLDEALASYTRALELKADYAECHCNLGILLTELKRWDGAMASLDRAIALNPDFAAAYLHRGKLSALLHEDQRAIADFDRVAALDPLCADAHESRAHALIRLQRYEEAIASGERAGELKPDGAFLLGIKLQAMQLCDWRNLEADVRRLVEGLEGGQKMTAPFGVLPLVASPPLQQKAARIWVREHFPADHSLPPIPRRARHGKLRIGYFSADLYDHVVGVAAVQMFEQHDRSHFELTAFSFGPDTQDHVRKRLERAFDRFIDARGRSDRDLALLAREYSIDIAVDLGAHSQTASNRIFAMRAAPVQVNYLGYPGTSGADYMDYLIADRTIVPRADFPYYDEKIVHLPNSYLPYDTSRRSADAVPTRARLGLPENGFVFCNFNGAYKISPPSFESWMRILARVEGSVLWLARNHPTAAANLRREAERRGIDPQRLIFAPRVDSALEHLARLSRADLFLDTLPYNAHVTAMDALWVGVPVLTRIGETFSGRVAASLLRTINMPELVATSTEQYENLAVELATQPTRLHELKEKVARHRACTALFDTKLFTKHLEAAYTAMQARYEADLPPDHIELAP